MAERIKPIKEWFKKKNEELSKRAKIIWIAGSVLFVFLVVFLILFLSGGNYVVFNKGLTPEASNQIIAKLSQFNIDYQIEDGGSTILVDEDQISQARIQLSMSGMSASQALTYDDIQDKIGFTTSNETRNKLFLQVQKSEIASALMSLEPIEKATVEIYVKKSSTFVNLDEDVSRASVVLTIKDNRKLSKEQVEGIMSFIVTSVRGLEKDKVTLIDQNGIKLNANLDESFSSTVSSQDELKVSIEERLNTSITKFLSNVYGEGNVEVKSSVVLDFDSNITEITEFSPSIPGTTEGMIRSVNQLKEKVINKSVGGAPGTPTNTTDVPEFPTADGDGSSGYEKSQSTMNYELNEMVKRLEKAKGQISDISVAVILNKKALVDEKLSAEDEVVLVNLIKSAAGFNDTRNVTVMTTEFKEEELIPVEVPSNGFFGVPLWVWIVIAVGIIVIIVIAIVITKKRKKKTDEIIEEIQTEQEELEEIRTDFEDKSSPKYQIEKFIDSRPEVVARLIRSWMNDD